MTLIHFVLNYYHGIRCLGIKKMLITANVDYSSQTLTLSKVLPAQKGRLFNALFEPQCSENHTLFNGTYPFRPNKGVPPPPRPPRCNLRVM